jgi:hypothetical protein
MAICVKMHDVEIVADGAGNGANNMLPGVVRSHAYLGSHRDYVVDVGQDLLVSAPAGPRPRARIESEGALPGESAARSPARP